MVRMNKLKKIIPVVAWLYFLLTIVTLSFAFELPIQDLPNHAAIARYAINTPDWLYTNTWARTYLLQDVLLIVLGVKWTIFLALLCVPVCTAVALKIVNKPISYSVLSFPLVWSRLFFKGNFNFIFATGFALIACTLLDRGKYVHAALLSILILITHPFPIVLVLGGICLIFGRFLLLKVFLLPYLPYMQSGRVEER